MKISVQDIKDDRYSGSFEISQNSLIFLREFISKNTNNKPDKLVEATNNIGKEIIKSQPHMVGIRKKISIIVYHMKRLLKTEKTIEEIKQSSLNKIDEVLKNAEEKKKQIGKNGTNVITNNCKVLTISSSSLVKEIFYSAHKLNRKFTVYCLESRPQNEGHLLARELTTKGISVVLTTDAMMGQVIHEVNMVISGADRIYESGFVNKTGSLPLAIIAHKFNVPFYVASETDKILKEIDRSLRFYQQNPDDIIKQRNKRLEVSNLYFESIEFDFVSKIICEDGVFDINTFKSWYLED